MALIAALAWAPAPAFAQDADRLAPFITTPEEVVERMLVLGGTGPNDRVIDLGSGDGRIVIMAAQKFGASGLGLDLDEKLVLLAREKAAAAGVAARATFEVRDVLQADVSRADVVTIYLLPSLMRRLQPKLLYEMKPGARIVAHAFAFEGWQPDRSEKVRLARRHEGQGDESTVHLWVVPAQARGRWVGGGWDLTVQQNFQAVDVQASFRGQPLELNEARLSGVGFAYAGSGYSFRGRIEGARMLGELTRGDATVPLLLERK